MQVRDYGGDGEALVFLHFSGANMEIRGKALPYFAGRYRSVLVDLRGHGSSDRPEAGYGLEEMARDAAGLILGLGRAHILGSSLEAEIGLALAALARKTELRELPGWSHPFGWLLDPRTACEAVLEFLARNAGSVG